MRGRDPSKWMRIITKTIRHIDVNHTLGYIGYYDHFEVQDGGVSRTLEVQDLPVKLRRAYNLEAKMLHKVVGDLAKEEVLNYPRGRPSNFGALGKEIDSDHLDL